MSAARAVLMGIAFGVSVAILLGSDWLAGLSDSVWWRAVPWFLIVAIWAFIIYRIRRRSGARSAERESTPR
ncbi:MAG: hypothetical protein H0U67_14555 [Gemmatimonadetes bacterium]|nr:hypothetical protein [Gemmatimonadota bacterium]